MTDKPEPRRGEERHRLTIFGIEVDVAANESVLVCMDEHTDVYRYRFDMELISKKPREEETTW
jgi:hypothetical protein